MNSALIKNANIITFVSDSIYLENKSVLINDGKVESIYDDIPKQGIEYDEIIDAGGKILLPSFINIHTHLYSTFARGLTKIKSSNNFEQVLENLWWRLDKKLNSDDIFYSAIVMLINAIKHGTTTIFDHHASPFSIHNSLFQIEEAVNKVGLRACLCFEVSDRDNIEKAKHGIDENLNFIKHCNKYSDSKIQAMFGLHAAFTVSDKTFDCVREKFGNSDIGFHIHTAEDKIDNINSYAKYNKSVVERLKEFSILGNKSILAHCVHIDEKDMELIAASNTIVAYNPQSNMNNAVGISDVLEMNSKGILVGFGTDGMTMNMLEELRAGIWQQHLKNNNPSIGFKEINDFLFVNNPLIAERIFNTKFGKIEKGSVADLVLIDYNSPTPINSDNIYGHLVFGISQEMVDTTICAGKILMKNKKLINIDEEKINFEAKKSAEKLWNRI